MPGIKLGPSAYKACVHSAHGPSPTDSGKVYSDYVYPLFFSTQSKDIIVLLQQDKKTLAEMFYLPGWTESHRPSSKNVWGAVGILVFLMRIQPSLPRISQPSDIISFHWLSTWWNYSWSLSNSCIFNFLLIYYLHFETRVSQPLYNDS